MKKDKLKNNFGIILLERDRLEYFDVSNKKVFVFKFTEKLVSDLEIVNRNDLEIQLILFINYHKIHPCHTITILSANVTSEKDIIEGNDSFIELNVNNFLYFLPFEEVIHKTYKMTKGYRVVAVNFEFFQSFKEIFTKMGFLQYAAIPASIAGINIKNLDEASVNYLMAKLDFIKEQTMVAPEKSPAEKQPEQKEVFGVKRILLLVGVFGLLLLVMLFMLYQQANLN